MSSGSVAWEHSKGTSPTLDCQTSVDYTTSNVMLHATDRDRSLATWSVDRSRMRSLGFFWETPGTMASIGPFSSGCSILTPELHDPRRRRLCSVQAIELQA